jgi:hypothetical protein
MPQESAVTLNLKVASCLFPELPMRPKPSIQLRRDFPGRLFIGTLAWPDESFLNCRRKEGVGLE